MSTEVAKDKDYDECAYRMIYAFVFLAWADLLMLMYNCLEDRLLRFAGSKNTPLGDWLWWPVESMLQPIALAVLLSMLTMSLLMDGIVRGKDLKKKMLTKAAQFFAVIAAYYAVSRLAYHVLLPWLGI